MNRMIDVCVANLRGLFIDMSVLRNTTARLKSLQQTKQAYSSTKVAVLVVTFLLYLLLGAILFQYFEKENERKSFNYVRDRLGSFYDQHSHCMDPVDLVKMLHIVAKACEEGFHDLEKPEKLAKLNETTFNGRWDFANAFFFSATVVTTIGYGRLAPRTREGRNACILYALLGIPLTAMLLNEIGQVFKHKAKYGVKKISTILQKVLKNKKFTSLVTWFVTFMLVYILIICLPAIIFKHTEGWSYQDAHYYCFITLTTIGFGDHVVGNNRKRQVYRNPWSRWTFKLLTTFYLLCGLSVIAIVFNAFASGGKSKLEELRRRRQDQNRISEAIDVAAPPQNEMNTRKSKEEPDSNGQPVKTVKTDKV